ncbi:MAG TPA: SRPBCC family protein [Pseudonocardiaceae bacterium]
MPPRGKPAYDGPRPNPARTGYASVTHTVLINAAPERVRSWNDDPDRPLEDVVKFDSDFPSVADTEPLVGEWIPGSRVGNRRRVRFTDGNYLAEEVLNDEPELFRYMIWGFTSGQRVAIRHGLAEFRFVAQGEGTRLEWTYSFLPRLFVFRPFVQRFLTRVMTPMMTTTLAAMRDGVEAS